MNYTCYSVTVGQIYLLSECSEGLVDVTKSLSGWHRNILVSLLL